MEILKVENLVKTYGEGDNIVNAVDNISLSVNKGGLKKPKSLETWLSGRYPTEKFSG